MSRVYQYIMDRLPEKMHMTLLDPDKQDAVSAGKIACDVVSAGTDAIMIGGSTGLNRKVVAETIDEIKKAVDVPVIIFPTDSSTVSPNADAIYFMSLLNSSSLRYVIREQAASSVYIKKTGLEPISMGYIVIEPGGRVGEVGNADLIKKDDCQSACAYALAGELLGMKMIYLEAGSGANTPVPIEMITAVRECITVPLIAGGGIKTPEAAGERAEAGADIIVTGTVVERASDIYGTVRDIVREVKKKR